MPAQVRQNRIVNWESSRCYRGNYGWLQVLQGVNSPVRWTGRRSRNICGAFYPGGCGRPGREYRRARLAGQDGAKPKSLPAIEVDEVTREEKRREPSSSGTAVAAPAVADAVGEGRTSVGRWNRTVWLGRTNRLPARPMVSRPLDGVVICP